MGVVSPAMCPTLSRPDDRCAADAAAPTVRFVADRQCPRLGHIAGRSEGHIRYKRVPAIWDTIWPMARREVLVQLDDDLVNRLDALAAELDTSRSELLRRG